MRSGGRLSRWGWLGDGGVTYVTEVVVLNCDVKNSGFGVSCAR